MFELVLIFAVFLLIIFLAITINKKYERNIKSIFLAFIFSFLSVQAVIFIQQILFQVFAEILSDENSKKAVLFNSFIVTGFVEETIKLLFFYIFILITFYRALPKNLGLFALFYGLVFAQFENIAYIIQDINSIKMRIFTATVLHTTIAIYYAKFILASSKQKKLFFILSACILHSFYNFFLRIGGFFSIFAIPVLILLIDGLKYILTDE